MKGHFYKPNCKCEKGKKCTCGATWSYMIDVGRDPVTGRRKQKKKGGFATKKEAQEAAAIALAEVSQGTYVEEKNITFEAFAKEWLEMYKNSGRVKESTIWNRGRFLKHLLPYLGNEQIKKITKRQYQEVINSIFSTGLSENTIICIHSTGRLIFKKANELEIIKNNPTDNIILPKYHKTVEALEMEKQLPKYMEKNELVAFLKAAKIWGLFGDYALFTTLAHTGMRVGEICALKWTDVNFQEKYISITKTIFNFNDAMAQYKIFTPKTKKSIRCIDIENDVINALLEYKTEQNKLKMKFRQTYIDNDFIFVCNTVANAGLPYYTKHVRRRMKRLLELANLPKHFTVHSLRHTSTSLLAEAGEDLQVIMDRLGHSGDAVTRDIYLHVTKSRKRKAAKNLERLLHEI